jgi:tetratricopeptide (TPR) repeat protein
MIGRYALCIRALFAVVVLGLLASCGTPEERAQSHYERGLELLEDKKLAKAEIEFKNALQLNPRLASAWYGLADIAEQRTDIGALGELLQKVVELDAKHADARLRLARLSLLRGEFDKALQFINDADELQPGTAAILTTRAATLLKLGDRQGALADAQRALALNATDVEALGVIAADKLSFGDTSGALETIDRGLAGDPFNLGLLLFKMKIFEQQDNPKAVEGIMRTIVSAHPKEKGLRRALASYYARQGRKDEAEREMRALADASPDDASAGLELAEFLRVVRGVDAARGELARRIEAGGERAHRYRVALARLEFAVGRFDAAKAMLDDVIAKGESGKHVSEAKLLLARMLLERKDTEAASLLVGEVLADDAKNVDALHLRAGVHLAQNRIDEAVADARQALNEKPDAVSTLELLSLALERGGSVELAEERLADAMKASNMQPELVQKYANFLLRRGALDRADDLLTRATVQRPNEAGLLKSLAAVRLRRQDWEGAQSIAEALKKLGDRSGAADQILGSALAGQSKFDDSIRTFQAAYQATPAAVRPMYSLVMAYLRANKVAEAEAFLDSVLKASPANAQALVLLGSIQASRNAADEAVASFKKAIASQPQNAVGYAALAGFHLSRRDLAAAEEQIRAGLAKIPGQFALRLTLAGILEQKNDIEAAIGEYEALLKDYPDALIVVNNLASLLSDHRSDKESLDRAYELAQRLKDGQAPHFRDTTGWISYLRGDYRQALAQLEQAVADLPSIALVRYHLGLTHAALNQKAKAVEHLSKAVELAPEGEQRRKTQAALDKVKTATP